MVLYCFPVTKHILTPPGMPPGVKAGGGGDSEGVNEVSLTLPITTTIHMRGGGQGGGGQVITKPDISSKQKDLGPKLQQQQQQQTTCGGLQMVCCMEGRGTGVTSPVTATTTATGGSVQQVVVVGAGKGTAGSSQPLPAQDDLRAYAYEGDNSPSGSLSSTVLGEHN